LFPSFLRLPTASELALMFDSILSGDMLYYTNKTCFIVF
jgi:hypothetical protein